MKTRFDLLLTAATLKLILISLIAIFLSSVSVFAQDLNSSNDAKAGEEYFVLIATSGNSLNVRQNPTSLSPIVGKLLNGFDIPPRTMERWNALIAWMKETDMAGNLEDDSYRELIRNRVRTGPQVEEIVSQISKFIASLPAEEVYHRAQQIRLAWAIIRSPEENLDDPHFREDRKFFVDIYHPNIGKTFIYPGAPYSFTETPWTIRNCAPEHGENTNVILIEELGLYEGKINKLRENGVI